MKIVILFPGYASQFVGMGKELYDEHRIMQEYFEEASNCLNINFVKLAFASSDAELSSMSNAITSIFVLGCSLAALLKQEGVEPSLVAGYNAGEYSALCVAGGITFPDGLYMLSKYAALTQEIFPTIDVKIIEVTGIERQELQTLCAQASQQDELVSIAVYETERHMYVSGVTRAVQRLMKLLAEFKEVRVKDAPIEMGLHSPLAHPIVSAYQRSLEKVDFKDLTVPLLTCVQADAIVGGQTAKAAVIESLERPVLWEDMMHTLSDADMIIQVGPGVHQATLVKEEYPEKAIFSLNTPEDLKVIKAYVASYKATREK